MTIQEMEPRGWSIMAATERPPTVETGAARVTAESPAKVDLEPAIPRSENADSTSTGQWLEQKAPIRLTFAGFLLHTASIRCMTLLRPLGRPEHPITPALFDLLPTGVRALQICAQPISSKLPRVSLIGNGICYVPVQGKRFFIDLNGTFDSYLEKLAAKTRYNIKRTIRIFSDFSGGTVQWREFRDRTQMTEFQKLAIEVSMKTYQHRQLLAGLETSPAFWEEIVRCAAEDRVRGYILFHRETPIAYSLRRGFGDDLLAEKIGFDPSYAAYGPGIVLFYLVLQRLFAEDRFRRFDLGPGEYPYKAQFATGSVDAADIYYFRLGFRNAVLVGALYILSATEDMLKYVLNFLGLRQQALKKALHRRRR